MSQPFWKQSNVFETFFFYFVNTAGFLLKNRSIDFLTQLLFKAARILNFFYCFHTAVSALLSQGLFNFHFC